MYNDTSNVNSKFKNAIPEMEIVYIIQPHTIVKPPNKGHIGDGPFVHCRELVLFSEVTYWNVLKDKY